MRLYHIAINNFLILGIMTNSIFLKKDIETV